MISAEAAGSRREVSDLKGCEVWVKVIFGPGFFNKI
jgi:hypothetical protein